MSEQYFTGKPTSESHPVDCKFEYRGHTLRFTTDAGVFSKGELDNGTRILLKALPDELHGRVLDLGCGWGPVGVSVNKTFPETDVVMSDVNERALSLSQANCKRNGTRAQCVLSDGLDNVEGMFDVIITNPPIRAGKQVIYRMFAQSAEKLNADGELYIVIRKQQGAESAIKYLKTLFDSVDTIEKSGGFWIIRCRGGKTHEV